MKKMLLVVLALIALAVPASVFAQNAGYESGFYIKNDDNTFKLLINGRVQPKYAFTKQGDGVRDPSDPTGATILNSKISTFSIRRAEVKFTAFVHEKLSFRVKMKHATNSQDFSALNAGDATVSYEVMPQFVVTAGMVGLPLDIIGDTSSAWYVMNEPPITNTQTDGVQRITPLRNSFGAPDGLGINFAGEISKFFYSASIVNGAESNYAFNPNMRISAGTRLGYNILDPVPGSQTDFECSSKPKLTISGGFNYGAKRVDPNTGADISYMLTASTGVALRWGGFAFNGEGYWRRTRITSPGTALWSRPQLDDIGYYASVGYYVIPQKLEIAAIGAQIFREGPDNNSHEFGGGINWYIFDNYMKLQGNFTWNEDFDDILGLDNNNIFIGSIMLSALF